MRDLTCLRRLCDLNSNSPIFLIWILNGARAWFSRRGTARRANIPEGGLELVNQLFGMETPGECVFQMEFVEQ